MTTMAERWVLVQRGGEPTTPHRVQLRRTKGWRVPPDTKKVDRTTKWGNPFSIGRGGDRAECVARFERLLAGECANETERAWLSRALAHRAELRGKNLACWCALDAPCHGDALLRFASDESSGAM
jgi:Domain of unknown function (DUF4326)